MADSGGEAAALQIRALQADDLAAYKALRDTMLATFPEAYTSDAETEARRPAEQYRHRVGGAADDDAPFTLGAWRDGRLVGAVSVERDLRIKVRHIGHVVGMMVLASEQARGVGRALLQACIARARRVHGLELLTLTVTADSARAVSFYERGGFARYGSLPRAIKLGERYLDKHHMVCTL